MKTKKIRHGADLPTLESVYLLLEASVGGGGGVPMCERVLPRQHLVFVRHLWTKGQQLPCHI